MAGDLLLEEGRASSMKGALAMLSATCTHTTAWQPECEAVSFILIYCLFTTISDFCRWLLSKVNIHQLLPLHGLVPWPPADQKEVLVTMKLV